MGGSDGGMLGTVMSTIKNVLYISAIKLSGGWGGELYGSCSMTDDLNVLYLL